MSVVARPVLGTGDASGTLVLQERYTLQLVGVGCHLTATEVTMVQDWLIGSG